MLYVHALFVFDIWRKMVETCVRAYGSDPKNSATYEAILNLITHWKLHLITFKFN